MVHAARRRPRKAIVFKPVRRAHMPGGTGSVSLGINRYVQQNARQQRTNHHPAHHAQRLSPAACVPSKGKMHVAVHNANRWGRGEYGSVLCTKQTNNEVAGNNASNSNNEVERFTFHRRCHARLVSGTCSTAARCYMGVPFVARTGAGKCATAR